MKIISEIEKNIELNLKAFIYINIYIYNLEKIKEEE